MVGSEYAYRYAAVSTYRPRTGLALATSGGASPHPHFFRAFVAAPDQAARALLAVAEVARTRYFDPGAAARSRDPVVTSNGSVLRFESFSACNGVYARFDLDDAGFEGDLVGRGTTNVDVNDQLRAALANVATGDPLRLSVGHDDLTVELLDGAVVERKVPLPDRWLRGFAEVQIASAGMVEVARLGAAAARSVVRDLPARRTGNRPLWVVFGHAGARLSQRPDGATPSLVGPQRLTVLRRVLPYVRGLTVYAPPPRGRLRPGGSRSADATLRPSAWVVDLEHARLTLVVSPELFRGFSGEGAVLEALANVDGRAVARTASLLDGQAVLDPETLAEAARTSTDATSGALRVLGAAGRTGYDLDTDGFFHRDLPFDRSSLEAMQPRLQKATVLAAKGAVRRTRPDAAAVDSGATTYTVRSTPDGDACTCAWFAKHRGERGPCTHVLAVQLVRARTEQPT